MRANQLESSLWFKCTCIWFVLFVLFLSCENNKKLNNVSRDIHKSVKTIKRSGFERDLKSGSFFKNSEHFYILLTEDVFYIISSDANNLSYKFMVHFVFKDNTFENHSFTFTEKEIDTSFEDFRVAKINIPSGYFFKFRIGQYNSKGNVWAQEFSPTEAMANPLLKYNNEFE